MPSPSTSVAPAAAPAGRHRQDEARLLWTGGWDSSFRLMQLLLVEGRPVQPVYVIHPERTSTLLEVRTMETMRAAITARMPDPSLLAPTEVRVWTHYPPSAEQRALFEAIAARAPVGKQYLHLAAVADALGWEGAELCMQAHDDGPTPLHEVVFVDDRGTLNGSPESALFRYWSFPVLHVTKPEMAEVAREHGFLDVLLQRWFCQSPLLGRACGVCRPCQVANPDGVRFAPRPAVVARQAYRRGHHLARRAGRAVGLTA